MGKLEIDPNLKNKLEKIFVGKKVIVPEKKRTSLPVFAREKTPTHTTPRVSQPAPQPPPHTVAPARVSQQPTFSLQINISGDVKDAIVFASVSMLMFRIGYVILFL